jgi:hypothetical protein
VLVPVISVRSVGTGARVPEAVASTVVIDAGAAATEVLVDVLSVRYSAEGKSEPMVNRTVPGATTSEADAVS